MNQLTVVKIDPCSDIMWNQVYIRLDQLRVKTVGDYERYIPWCQVYQNICRLFTLKKQDCKALIFYLKDKGYVEISCRGIKLNFKIKNDKVQI